MVDYFSGPKKSSSFDNNNNKQTNKNLDSFFSSFESSDFLCQSISTHSLFQIDGFLSVLTLVHNFCSLNHPSLPLQVFVFGVMHSFQALYSMTRYLTITINIVIDFLNK